jgi:phosphate-selective porin OprO and OprP
MFNKAIVLALLASTSCILGAAPALAQQVEADENVAQQQLGPEDAAAKAAFLEAQVDALQQQLDELKKQVTGVTPVWRGAPQLAGSGGWTFKPRGRLQFDTGYVANPDGAIATNNLGFNTRARRIRLGAEGAIPGGFGYKFEMDFANSSVGFGDAIITYQAKGKPWSVALGNHDTFESLEQISSSRFTSFIERAQMNDAFSHARRIGISFGLADNANVFRLNAGLFAGHSIDASFDNDGWIAAARATYSPQALGGVLHLGANYQHRDFSSNNGTTASVASGAPSNNQQARYRARPFLQTTDVRFVDTGTFAAKGDNVFGLELAGVFGSLHMAGEAQWTKINAYAPGSTLSGRDAFPGTSFLVPSGNPTFSSWYAEAGYFFTGETRGYKNGAWDRTKVSNPLSKGGSGALQINARYDYLDLSADELQSGFTNNFTTGGFTPSINLGRGGTQSGYLGSLIWIPEDYVRFILQYAHTAVTGGPFAATVRPASTNPLDRRSYGVNSVALRAQVDF